MYLYCRIGFEKWSRAHYNIQQNIHKKKINNNDKVSTY